MGVRLAGFDYRIIVIAAKAAIQDGALPAASTAPPPPALHNGAPTHQAYRHCGEGRNPGRSIAGCQHGSTAAAPSHKLMKTRPPALTRPHYIMW